MHDIEEELKMKQEELLLRSIIDIYNNEYKDYESYYKAIKDTNDIIDKQNSQFNPNSMSFRYVTKSPILSKRIVDLIIELRDIKMNKEEMKIFRSSKSGMMFEKSKELSYLEFMIIYIESKIDKYEKITTMNMSQIISIYRALICDIKIDIRRLEKNAK